MKRIPYDLPQAKLILYEHFFAAHIADDYFNKLKETICWEEKYIKLFGKLIKQPRLVAFYGDENISYKYSGVKNDALPWCKSLLSIKEKIEKELDCKFNSCLVNLYRNGQDSMGWHQDNEKELGAQPVICSVTFGEKRKFQLAHIANKRQRLEIVLEHGSVLLMGGATQQFYKHQIPKTKKDIGERINLTFRKVLN